MDGGASALRHSMMLASAAFADGRTGRNATKQVANQEARSLRNTEAHYELVSHRAVISLKIFEDLAVAHSQERLCPSQHSKEDNPCCPHIYLIRAIGKALKKLRRGIVERFWVVVGHHRGLE